MKRYNLLDGEVYGKRYQMVEERDGDWVWYEDVEDILEALEYAVNIYGRFGAVVNEPHNPGEWIEQAKAAIAKAKGEQHGRLEA